jgi:hypothetical protein
MARKAMAQGSSFSVQHTRVMTSISCSGRLIMIISYAMLRYYCHGRWLTDCMCMGEVKTRLPTPRPSAQTALYKPNLCSAKRAFEDSWRVDKLEQEPMRTVVEKWKRNTSASCLSHSGYMSCNSAVQYPLKVEQLHALCEHLLSSLPSGFRPSSRSHQHV